MQNRSMRRAPIPGLMISLCTAVLCACGGGSGSVPITSSSATATATSVSAAAPTVRVQGAHLVDGSGNPILLHGVDVSGLESVAVQGYDPSNPWGSLTGTPTPNWSTIKTWKANAVRLPLNEASWLGYTCTDANGNQRDPDPGHNYQATVAQSVSDASAAGLYVILDLHWSAPGTRCPLAQNIMADADNSVTFWTQIATTFKSYPNVIFELFNEPALSSYVQGAATDWQVLLQGGTLTAYNNENGYVSLTWQSAGMQQLLDAVRGTGATNVVLVAGLILPGISASGSLICRRIRSNQWLRCGMPTPHSARRSARPRTPPSIRSFRRTRSPSWRPACRW